MVKVWLTDARMNNTPNFLRLGEEKMIWSKLLRLIHEIRCQEFLKLKSCVAKVCFDSAFRLFEVLAIVLTGSS